MKCIECGRGYPEDELRYRCECGGLLEDVFDGKNITLWKYESWLPVKKRVLLNKGGMPLYRLKNLGKELGVPKLYAKNEGNNLTGCFILPEPTEPTLEAFKEVIR